MTKVHRTTAEKVPRDVRQRTYQTENLSDKEDKNLFRKQMLLAPDSTAQRRAENASITDSHQAMKNSAKAN